MSEFLLSMTNISKAFSGVQALDHVDLFVRPGKIMCLAGENGSGKSTLVKIISGVYSRDAGEVVFDGHPIESIIPAKAVAMGIQVIYQDFSIFPNLTVMENLSINTELAENRRIINWNRMRANAQQALDKIGYHIPLDAKMRDLSVADKQLVAICRALLHNAKLIIMDEPTTALTKREVESLFKTVLQLKNQGIAIMFISHKLEEVFEISDDITILRNGKNVYTGHVHEISSQEFTYHMTGRCDLEELKFSAENISDQPVLEVRNLSHYHKYQDVSFDLRKGEILGITGLLGSGRTELALSLFGSLKPTAGEIKLNGKTIKINSPIDAHKNHIGYVPEDRLTEGLFLQQPIADNIASCSLKELANKAGIIADQEIEDNAQKWVKKLRIATDNVKKKASTLSGGNQQKIVLAKWLNTDLQVLILNAPTVGVDVGSKSDLHQLFQDLARDNLAIILISDDISEVTANCNRVLIMKDGKVVQVLKDNEITEQAILEVIR